MKFVDDLYRYEGESAKLKLVQFRNVLFVPPIQYIYFFRKLQNSRFIITRIFLLCVFRFLQYLYNIQIPYQTKIDKGFRILHYGTIVVNPNTIIGKNFNIAQGCLIGFAHGKREGVPTIGDNVVMGANSIIVGGKDW